MGLTATLRDHADQRAECVPPRMTVKRKAAVRPAARAHCRPARRSLSARDDWEGSVPRLTSVDVVERLGPQAVVGAFRDSGGLLVPACGALVERQVPAQESGAHHNKVRPQAQTSRGGIPTAQPGHQ